jgi:ribose transport system permease protein
MSIVIDFVKKNVSRSMLALWAILITLFVITGLVDHYFFSIASIGVTFQLAAPLALFGAGQTIVMLTGGIDLSLTMVATGAAYIVSVKASSGIFMSIVWALGCCVLIGAINGLAIGVLKVNPLIMTLGVSAILVGVYTVGVSTFLKGAGSLPDSVITMSTGTIVDPISWPLVIWILIGSGVLFLLAKTGLGRLIYAIGDNSHAARLAGVKVWRVQLAAYILCAVLAGCGGILLAGQSGAVAISLANSYLLPSVAAVVIGGTSIMGGMGGYTGTIMGALILAVLSYLLATLNSTEAVKQIIYGTIVLTLAWIYARIAQKS